MRAHIAVVFALAAALACSRPALNLGEGCQVNSECADPLVCVIGSCRRQCLDTRDCGAGLLCIVTSAELGGGCQLPTEMSCTLTSECHAPLVCQNGTCTTVCIEDRDCAAGAHCTMDSAGVHACYDTAVQPCLYNSDCPDPMICDGEQRCRLECVGDRDCISPRVCAGNLCVLPGAGDERHVSAEVLDAADIRDIGPYRMATRIAAGATADVFRALKRQSAGADRAVVIKRLLPSLAANAEARAMFEHEAKLGLRVRHRNVVEVLDYDDDGECPYLVLEYVFGVDLRRLAKWLKREDRTLSVPLAAWVATELLAGLHAVHVAKSEGGAPLGIVHRDVSPSNVFISVHGDVKLGDLGIARALGAGRGDLTRGLGARSTAAKGKLGYLAPEQVQGGAADTRSDVFAAATIAAELLMGAPLFGRGSELEVLLAIRDARCDALLDRATSWPPKLLDALMTALARLPERRTQSAESLRAALAEFVTVPVVELHGLLGAEVVGALDAAPDTGNRSSLARTIEADTGRIAIIAESGAPQRRERETMRPGVGAMYSVRSGANALGPWPYARVVQALHTGEVEPSSLVSVDGGAEKPIASHSALAAHLPPSTRISTLPPPKPKPSKLGRTSESWNLGEAGLGSVLAQLLVDGETGLLVCEHDGTRKEIFVDRGAPTFVTSNRLGEMLGQRLVEQGVIDRVELDVALAAMPRYEGRLGDTLIALGLIDPLELFGHIAAQEREKLLDVFTWRAGRAALYRQAERPSRGFPLQLDAWDLLTQGLTRRLTSGRQIVDVRDVLMRSPTWAEAAIPLPVRLQVLLDSLSAPRALEEIAHSDVERADALVLVDLGAARGQERWPVTAVIKSGVSSPPERPDRIGQVLLGKLRVMRHLGGGGMGDVYEVEHMLTHHRRALKIVRAELARQPRYVERLLREASVAGRLKTPFVAETLDAGRLEDGSAYVLMELLSGRSLYDVLELDPRLPQRRVANILCQVAEGMGVAHAAGIVHRDLKPENVFLVGDDHEDRVKILDFGISKIDDPLAQPATRLTREGAVVGTPFYMSPEQAAGREVDPRADIWAMGVIAYEALTGKLPFNGSTVGEVMMLIASGNYPPILTRRPDVDPELCAVVDRALRPDPRDRYESAEAMRRELVRFATNEPAARAKTISDGPREVPQEVKRAIPRASPAPEPAARSSPSVDPPPAASLSSETLRARRNSAALLALVVAVTIGVTVFVSTSQRSVGGTERPPPTTPPATRLGLEVPASVTASPHATVEDVDAGAIAELPPPSTSTSTSDRPPVRPPPHTRTRAEVVGLEGNPYGP